MNYEYRVARLAKEGESVSEDFFELHQCEVPVLGDNDVLVRLHVASVDPAFRATMRSTPLEKYMLQPYEIGATVRSFAVGRVVASNNPKLSVGTLVGGCWWLAPWRLYQAYSGDQLPPILDNSAGIDESQFLGAAGMPGITALMAIRELSDPTRPKQPLRNAEEELFCGKTALVTGAAGAVGRRCAALPWPRHARRWLR